MNMSFMQAYGRVGVGPTEPSTPVDESYVVTKWMINFVCDIDFDIISTM